MIFQTSSFFSQGFTTEVKRCLWCIAQLQRYFLPSHEHNNPLSKLSIKPNVFTPVSELRYKPKSNYPYHTWSFQSLLFVLFITCLIFFLLYVKFCRCTIHMYVHYNNIHTHIYIKILYIYTYIQKLKCIFFLIKEINFPLSHTSLTEELINQLVFKWFWLHLNFFGH